MSGLMKDVQAAVEKILRKKLVAQEGEEFLWMPWGSGGLRLSLVAPVKGQKTLEKKSVTVGKLTGSYRDQVNGIVGKFLANY